MKICYITSYRKLKAEQGFGQSVMNDGLSVISETPSVFTGKITHAEKHISKID